MANEIYKAGSMPELEVFDSGDIQLANALLASGVLKSPPLFQIVMGVRYGFISTPQTLIMRNRCCRRTRVGGLRHRPLGIPDAGRRPGSSAAMSASAWKTTSTSAKAS